MKKRCGGSTTKKRGLMTKKKKKERKKRTSSSVVDVLTLGATISARCNTLKLTKGFVSDSNRTRESSRLPLFRGLALGSRFVPQDEGITRADGYAGSFDHPGGA